MLVVDDSEDNRLVLAEYLGICGFRVTAAANGEDALVQAAAVRPRIVLMDLGMPGAFDGLEATRRLKADPLTKDATVFAVTAHGRERDRVNALDAGCAAVFVKPVDLIGLVAEIERVTQAGARRPE